MGIQTRFLTLMVVERGALVVKKRWGLLVFLVIFFTYHISMYANYEKTAHFIFAFAYLSGIVLIVRGFFR